MNRITADREIFIQLFTERLLVEYLNYEIFRARITNLGLIRPNKNLISLKIPQSPKPHFIYITFFY